LFGSRRLSSPLLKLSSSRGLDIRLGDDELLDLLQRWVRFWVLDVQVIDDLGHQRPLATSFKVPTAPAIPRYPLRITADVVITR
jgi:hypothetical protein